MVSWNSAWIGVDDGRFVLEYATTPSVMLMQLCGNTSGGLFADKLRSKHHASDDDRVVVVVRFFVAPRCW